MESLENVALPPVPKGDTSEVILMPDLNNCIEADYDARNEIISGQLKLLMEMYMPYNFSEPIIFLKEDRTSHAEFWRFKPPLFENYEAMYNNGGIVSHISFSNSRVPLIFTAKSPKGIRTVVVDTSVVNSILRRCITGLKFTKIKELDKD